MAGFLFGLFYCIIVDVDNDDELCAGTRIKYMYMYTVVQLVHVHGHFIINYSRLNLLYMYMYISYIHYASVQYIHVHNTCDV